MIDINLIYDSLEELSNKDLQQQLWIDGSDEYMSTYTEAKCVLFDDSGLTRAVDSGYFQENFSTDLYKEVKKLDKLLNLVPENVIPEEIIEHEKMGDIRELSKKIIVLFKKEYNLFN